MTAAAGVLAVIPARAGSKSIPDKNIRPFGGKPLLAHSIEQALAARLVDRVIVSTDSAHYAAIARQYGAETPFLRPPELAADTSTDLEVFQHALEWLEHNESYRPEIVVHLRPTYPNRTPADIDRVVEILLQDRSLDSVRTVAPAPANPFKMWTRNPDGTLAPVVDRGDEAYNLPRQGLPRVFLQNACIDAVRVRVIREQRSMTGRRIFGYVMEECLDIDTHAELERARLRAAADGDPGERVFCFDVDGIIASLVPGNDYERVQPHAEVIDAVNRLHARGHRIVLYTARGTATGRDWRAVTEAQLARWGVRYDELVFGKPAADYYIDDRAIDLAELLRIVRLFEGDGREIVPGDDEQ